MGFSLLDAAGVANVAAAIAVGHPGTWAVRREELLEVAARPSAVIPV
jgi:bifunctional ADP-heptose synthase (sugar kinase/adenylyltransferase)